MLSQGFLQGVSFALQLTGRVYVLVCMCLNACVCECAHVCVCTCKYAHVCVSI